MGASTIEAHLAGDNWLPSSGLGTCRRFLQAGGRERGL